MSDERIRILEMFKEGKLSAEETLELLKALEEIIQDSEPVYSKEEIGDQDTAEKENNIFETADEDERKDEVDSGDENRIENMNEGDCQSKDQSSNGNKSEECGFKFPNGFKFSMPKIKIKVPKINIPDIQIPDVEIPEIKVPAINVSGMGFKSDSHHADGDISIDSFCNYDGDISLDNIEISGTGNFSGNVNASRINVSGMGNFHKSIRCDEISVSGKLHAGGTVIADHISILGSCSFDSDVKADEMSVKGKVGIKGSLRCDEVSDSGDFRIGGDVAVDSLYISGNFHAGRDIRADNIELNGYMEIGGNVNTDSFESTGSFNINGCIRADRVNIELNNACRVKGGIVAHRIVVTRAKDDQNICLEAPSLQADYAELENTRLNILKGHNIKIGSGCDIDRVEYTGELIVMEGANVKQQQKMK